MSAKLYRPVIAGFIGGVLSVLVFHQLALWTLTQLNWISAVVYSTRPIPPFGVPQIVDQGFWGGLWGIVFALVVPKLPSPLNGVLGGLLAGAIGPTLALWFVVAPIKGQVLGYGFHMPGVVLTPLVLALFGFGAVTFAGLISKLFNWK